MFARRARLGRKEGVWGDAFHQICPEVASSPAPPLPPADSETALADLALDVLRLVLADHWSWLCTENIQKVFNLLFGTLVQR